MVEFHWGGGGKAPPPKPPVSTPVHIGLLWRIKKFKLPTCDLQQELNSRGCAGLTSFYLRRAVLMISSVAYIQWLYPKDGACWPRFIRKSKNLDKEISSSTSIHEVHFSIECLTSKIDRRMKVSLLIEEKKNQLQNINIWRCGYV